MLFIFAYISLRHDRMMRFRLRWTRQRMGTGQLIEDTDNDVAVEHIVKSTKEPT